MGLSVLLLAPSFALAAPTKRTQRTQLPAMAEVAPSASTSAPPTEHRLLHPIGPEPESWDGDWPEMDMDLRMAQSPATPYVPAALDVPLCWCVVLHGTTSTLPGGGSSATWREVEASD